METENINNNHRPTESTPAKSLKTPSKIPTLKPFSMVAEKPSTPARPTTGSAIKTGGSSAIKGFGSAVKISSTIKPTSSALKTVFMRTPLTPSSQASTNAREAAKLAKEQSTAERIQNVAVLKDKWKREREIKVNLFKKKRNEELKRQEMFLTKAAEQRRIVLDRQREHEEKKKQIEKELLASSLEARAQVCNLYLK